MELLIGWEDYGGRKTVINSYVCILLLEDQCWDVGKNILSQILHLFQLLLLLLFFFLPFFFLAYNVCKIRIGQSQTKHSDYSLLKSQNHLIKVYIALAHFRFLVQYVFLYNMHTCTTHICLLYKGILCTIYTKK